MFTDSSPRALPSPTPFPPQPHSSRQIRRLHAGRKHGLIRPRTGCAEDGKRVHCAAPAVGYDRAAEGRTSQPGVLGCVDTEFWPPVRLMHPAGVFVIGAGEV